MSATQNVLVFDFGGVLFRWRPLEFMPRLLPQHAVNAESTRALVARFFEGFGGDWGEFDRGTIDVARLVPRIAARTGLAEAEVLRVIEAIPGELQAMPESVRLLERLRARGVRLLYLSNMPAPYAAHLHAHNPIDTWFEAGVYSSGLGVIKPEPGIFATLAERHALDVGRCLFIDDSPVNVVAARALGWQALHYTDAAACEAELERLGLL